MPLDGVTFLDHTADVGIDVEAGSAADLFHRAALGMLALLRGDDDSDDPSATGAPAPDRATGEEPAPDPAATGAPASGPATGGEPSLDTRSLALDGDGWAPLLADWLRELLFLHDTAHRDYVGGRMDRLEPTALRARIRTGPAAPAVREIKGVTYHELRVERTSDGWAGRVIFDV